MTEDPTVSDLDIMTGAVRYRRWLFSQTAAHLGQRVFEIGAGIGNYTEFLQDRECVVCLEINATAVTRLRARFSVQAHLHIVQGDITDPALGALAAHHCDTALCFNVLEHVADEASALRNIAHILTPGGRLLLIVPALPVLMGTVDQMLGHHRRYTRRSLRTAVGAAQYTVESMFYMNFPGIFGWFLNNRLLKRTTESPGQIKCYDRLIVPWLAPIERWLKPPLGLSLVCVARTGRTVNV